MAAIPAKLLKGMMTNLGPTGTPAGTNFDEGSIWYGFPKQWNVNLVLEPQSTSFQSESGDFGFNATSVKVGDWLASSAGGIAVKVVEITNVTDLNTIDVVVEDEDSYNTYADLLVQGTGIGPEGPCVVFEVDPNSGLPILTPMPVNYLDYTLQSDILSRFLRMGKLKAGGGGGSDVLTDTSGGSYDDGFIKGWTVGVTKLSDAMRELNVAINQVKPPEAPSLSTQLLDVEGGVDLVGGNPIILATGATDATAITSDGDRPAPGIVVKRLTRALYNTTEVGPFGPGNRGQLALIQNSTPEGAVDLTPGTDAGSYSLLEITTDTSYPTNQPGFNDALTARGVGLTAEPGLNFVQLTHSEGATSQRCYFVYDTSRTLPTVTSATVNVVGGTSTTYSSGVPHLNRDSVILVSGQVQDLATDVTLGRQNIQISTVPNNVGAVSWVSAGDNGLPKVPTKGAVHNFNDVRYVVSDTDDSVAYGSVQIQITARNPNGSTSYVADTKINVMRDGVTTSVGPIDENNIPVINLGELVEGLPLNGFRVLVPADDADIKLTPEASFVAMPDTWDSVEFTKSYEASVVGGILTCDLNDYSKYFPIGPDYSGKDPVQYATFAVCRTGVSRMVIQVRGKFTKMLVKLPGVTNTPLSPNGWWDTSILYEGAGTPGRDGVAGGCAAYLPTVGFDQDVEITFGPESSAFSNNNLILVRFALTGDDAVTGICFKGVD